tara:strand:- start:2657 stop:2944 length:288 start_codon:yes stop_codon:yes gene_type:complete
MGVKVNSRQVQRMFDDMLDIPKDVMQKAGAHFKKITPIDKGNAQRNTFTVNTTIKANYGYAGDLDAGKSRQAKDGMSGPTIKVIETEINNEIKRL